MLGHRTLSIVQRLEDSPSLPKDLPKPDFSSFESKSSDLPTFNADAASPGLPLLQVLHSPPLIGRLGDPQDPKLQFKKFLTGQFSGNYENHYREFEVVLNDYLEQLTQKNKSEQEAEILQLGSVSSSNEHYFDPTEEAKAYAREFFTAYWSDENNIEVINNRQQKKFKETKRSCNVPYCISFVAVEAETRVDEELQQEKICFVAVSTWGSGENREDWLRLKQFIQSYNERTQDLNLSENHSSSSLSSRSRFELLDAASGNFHELIAKALVKLREHKARTPRTRARTAIVEEVHYDPAKNCSEKDIGAQLAKIYFERSRDGKVFKTRGIANCFLYLYELGQSKKNYLMSLPLSEEKPQIKMVINGKFYYTALIPCCTNCQINKPGILSILAAAKAFGGDLYRKLLTSPERKRKSSLLVISPLQLQITPQRSEDKSNNEGQPRRASSTQNLFTSPLASLLDKVTMSSGSPEQNKRSKSVYQELLEGDEEDLSTKPTPPSGSADMNDAGSTNPCTTLSASVSFNSH